MRAVEKNGSPRVLVVDDNADLANTLVMLLTLHGYEARAAYDGCSAFEAAKAFSPHCILSDIDLPRLDGYGLAETLRGDERFKNVPLVAISGAGNEARATAAGFDRYLVKPVASAALVELLSKLTAMDSRIDRVEKKVREQGASIEAVLDVVKEVRADVKEIKNGLQEQVVDLKDQLRDVKAEVQEIKQNAQNDS